jgi:Leucine-rich repeat (LRR) protein
LEASSCREISSGGQQTENDLFFIFRIASIPSGIKLAGLRTFEIRCNSLSALPGSLLEKALASLTRLDLSFNKLKTIPAEIGSLKNLQELLLSRNSIESLPLELGDCESLTCVF